MPAKKRSEKNDQSKFQFTVSVGKDERRRDGSHDHVPTTMSVEDVYRKTLDPRVGKKEQGGYFMSYLLEPGRRKSQYALSGSYWGMIDDDHDRVSPESVEAAFPGIAFVWHTTASSGRVIRSNTTGCTRRRFFFFFDVDGGLSPEDFRRVMTSIHRRVGLDKPSADGKYADACGASAHQIMYMPSIDEEAFRPLYSSGWSGAGTRPFNRTECDALIFEEEQVRPTPPKKPTSKEGEAQTLIDQYEHAMAEEEGLLRMMEEAGYEYVEQSDRWMATDPKTLRGSIKYSRPSEKNGWREWCYEFAPVFGKDEMLRSFGAFRFMMVTRFLAGVENPTPDQMKDAARKAMGEVKRYLSQRAMKKVRRTREEGEEPEAAARGEEDLLEIPGDPMSHEAMANAFAAVCPDWIYTSDDNLWYAWDGGCWKQADQIDVKKAIARFGEELRVESQVDPGAPGSQLLLERGELTTNVEFRSSMVEALKTVRGVSMTSSMLNSRTDCLTFPAGRGVGAVTLNLITGETWAPRREDLGTQMTSVPYMPDLFDERVEEYWATTFPKHPEIRAALEEQSGLALLGILVNDVIHGHMGPGGAGKSSWAGSIARALGDYGLPMAKPHFILEDARGGNATDQDFGLLGLRWKRYVVIEEPKGWLGERALERSQPGTLRGAVKGKQGEVEFENQSTFFLLSNGWVRTKGEITASKRRFLGTRFEHGAYGSVEPGQEDNRIRDYLRDPNGGAPALLACALRGLRRLRDRGELKPYTVAPLQKAASDEWIRDSLPYMDFLLETFEFGPGFEFRGSLVTLYRTWAMAQGLEEARGGLNPKGLGATLKFLGVPPSKATNGARVYENMRQRADETNKENRKNVASKIAEKKWNLSRKDEK